MGARFPSPAAPAMPPPHAAALLDELRALVARLQRAALAARQRRADTEQRKALGAALAALEVRRGGVRHQTACA